MEAGCAWAEANLDFKYRIPAAKAKVPQIVVNGNTAVALGVLASGMDICAMYPITPATSASHYLSRVLRAGRRHRAPGRGRDRRVRVRDRRLVRRQLRGDDHVRAGLLAQAGRHRPGGDGRDSAGRRQRAARRAVDRPADQGRAGRPADVDLRQPRRRAEGRDGRDQHRGLLLLDDHGAQDRRDVQHGGRGAVGRQPGDRAAAVPAPGVQRGLAGAAARPVAAARGREALRLGPGDRHCAALLARPAGRHAHAHRPGARPRQQGRLRPGRSTRKACACAASSSRRCRRR